MLAEDTQPVHPPSLFSPGKSVSGANGTVGGDSYRFANSSHEPTNGEVLPPVRKSKVKNVPVKDKPLEYMLNTNTTL